MIQQARLPPLKLTQPIVTPCGNAEREKKCVAGKVPELQADDVHSRGNNLAYGERGDSDATALTSHQRPAGTGLAVRSTCFSEAPAIARHAQYPMLNISSACANHSGPL